MDRDERKIKKAIKATKKGKFEKAKRKLSRVRESGKSRTAAAFIRREENKARASSPSAHKVRTSLPLYKTEYN